MKPKDFDKLVQVVEAELEKKFGKGIIQTLGGNPIKETEVISTGSISVNRILGIGGIPRGRVTEIVGSESCICGDTFVAYNSWTADGRRFNAKGGSIRNLWRKFTQGKINNSGIFYTAPSVNEENRIIHNRIVDVVRIGIAPCYRMTTLSGEQIIATGDHRFLTGSEYKKLSDLKEDCIVMIHNNTHFKKPHAKSLNRSEVYVGYHPVAPRKKIRSRISRIEYVYKDYFYHRLRLSRAMVEADMNNLSLSDYIKRLNTGNVAGLKFLSRDKHVHHIDDDCQNDTLDNLEVISSSNHGRIHALERHNNLRFVAVEDKVKEIKFIGNLEVFDIKMKAPYHNYVANNFVTHNSGKTTLTLHSIAEAQKSGNACAFIDAEHALDLTYAKALGVDVDNLRVCQPDCGEQALEVLEKLVSSGLFALIVVDSVAALTPRSEIEGEMGDSSMGVHARLMSQAMRKLTGAVSRSNTAVVFINQLRSKIGVVFGNPEVATGGNALKFYASVRIDIRRIGALKKGDDFFGARTRVKVIKNKCAPPFRETEVDIRYGMGIDKIAELLDLSIEAGVIDKSGAWFSFAGDRIGQGRDNVCSELRKNKELEENVRKAYEIATKRVAQD